MSSTDRLLYRIGLVHTDLPFEETLARARIDEAAGSDPHRPGFSARIRAPVEEPLRAG